MGKKGKGTGPGRPKGSTNFSSDELIIREAKAMSRSDSLNPVPGIRRVSIETKNPKHALALEQLVIKLQSKDPELIALLYENTDTGTS